MFAPLCASLTTSLVWGVIWLIQAFAFFAAGIIIGLVAFKVCTPFRPPLSRSPLTARASRKQQSAAQQKADSEHFLPVPGSSGALPQLAPAGLPLLCAAATVAVLLHRW